MKCYFFLIFIYLFLVLFQLFFQNAIVTFSYCLISYVIQCLCKAPLVPCVYMVLFSNIEEMVNVNNTIHTTAMQQITAM